MFTGSHRIYVPKSTDEIELKYPKDFKFVLFQQIFKKMKSIKKVPW